MKVQLTLTIDFKDHTEEETQVFMNQFMSKDVDVEFGLFSYDSGKVIGEILSVGSAKWVYEHQDAVKEALVLANEIDPIEFLEVLRNDKIHSEIIARQIAFYEEILPFCKRLPNGNFEFAHPDLAKLREHDELENLSLKRANELRRMMLETR